MMTWLAAWRPLLQRHNATLIVVWDLPQAPSSCYTGGFEHCHLSIPDWIPRGTDMIRSWGFLQAWRAGAEFTLSLDDDVEPFGDPFYEYERVFRRGATVTEYLSVGALTSFGGPMRGHPKADPRPVAVQYGGWHGILDYSAETQLAGVSEWEAFHPLVVPVPRGAAVTGCAMNMAFRTCHTPVMWQLPLYEGRYNRWGDIWSGLIQKRVFDALDEAVVVNGKASAYHDRASDPHANLAREAPGVPVNELLWENLSAVGIHSDPLKEAHRTAYLHFLRHDPDYAREFLRVKEHWLACFA